jgi:hypothetical protein
MPFTQHQPRRTSAGGHHRMFSHRHAPGHVTHLATSASHISATVGLGFKIDGGILRLAHPCEIYGVRAAGFFQWTSKYTRTSARDSKWIEHLAAVMRSSHTVLSCS